MGILSAVGQSLGGLILMFGLIILIAAVAMSHFTQHSTIQPVLTNVIYGMLTKDMSPSDIEDQGVAYQSACVSENGHLELNASGEIGTISLNCTSIMEEQPQNVLQGIAATIFDQIYYRQNSCDVIQCIMQSSGNGRFLVLITDAGNKFFNSLIIPSIAAVIVGISVIAVSIRKWHGILKSVGITFIFVGISVLIFPFLDAYMQKLVPQDQASTFTQIMSTVYDPLKSELIIILVVGIMITIIGYIGAYLEKGGKEKEKDQNATSSASKETPPQKEA